MLKKISPFFSYLVCFHWTQNQWFGVKNKTKEINYGKLNCSHVQRIADVYKINRQWVRSMTILFMFYLSEERHECWIHHLALMHLPWLLAFDNSISFFLLLLHPNHFGIPMFEVWVCDLALERFQKIFSHYEFATNKCIFVFDFYCQQ